MMSKIKGVLDFMHQKPADRIQAWKDNHNALKEVNREIFNLFLRNVERQQGVR